MVSYHRDCLGVCALLPKRGGWAERLGLGLRGWVCARLGFISFSPSLLQFAIGSLMDDYLGECPIMPGRVVARGRGVWGQGWRWDLMLGAQMKGTVLLSAWQIQDLCPGMGGAGTAAPGSGLTHCLSSPRACELNTGASCLVGPLSRERDGHTAHVVERPSLAAVGEARKAPCPRRHPALLPA